MSEPLQQSNQQPNPSLKYEDTFIREVFVNYRPITIERFLITGPEDAVQFIRTVLPDNSREHFVALYLDSAHQVAAYSIISTGTTNSAVVHPREIFQRAYLIGAEAIVVGHNHPSGSLKASNHDLEVTERLKQCGELLGIPVIDSLIVTSESGFSISNRYTVRGNLGPLELNDPSAD